MRSLLKLAAAAVIAAVPMSAGAVTVIDDGDSVNVSAGDEFIWGIDGTGAAGMETVTFSAVSDPLISTATATIGSIVLSTFSPVSLAWIALGPDQAPGGGDDFLVSSTLVSVPTTSLSTTFTAPGQLVQQLIVGFGQSDANSAFDVEVSAVPLPASVLMLLGALGGLGFVGRRKRAAVA
jgi:hypothetical protein